MAAHDRHAPGGDQGALSEDKLTQEAEGRVPGAELPVAVYVSVAAGFAWMLLASWIEFGAEAGAEIDLNLGIATVLGIVLLALPVVVYAVGAKRFHSHRQRLDEFLGSRVEIATGVLTGWQVWIQILIVPLALALAAVAIGAVRLIVA